MRLLFLSYVSTTAFTDPCSWLERIEGYTGVLEALAKKHEVHSIEQIIFSGLVTKNGVQYHFRSFKRDWQYLKKLHKLAESIAPDLVIVHGLHFPAQVIHLRYTLPKGIKIILQHHAEKPFLGLRKPIQRCADRYIDAYLFSTHELGTIWLKHNIIRKAEKIHEVMEASSVFERSNRYEARMQLQLPAKHIFLWVGRLDRNKDPVTVVRTFLSFHEKHPDSALYMVYHTEELLLEINKLLESAVNNVIYLIGKIEHRNLQQWYNAADFIIAASYYEGSGVAVCEGMSCGCIPIITAIPSFRKMTQNGYCGFLFEPGNSLQLYKALQSAIHCNREKEREKVQDVFDRQLSFPAIARQFEDVFDECYK